LFWFRTQPGIKNASTNAHYDRDQHANHSECEDELRDGNPGAFEIEIVSAEQAQEKPEQISHDGSLLVRFEQQVSFDRPPCC
jgi:hypothetical protein